MNLKLDKISMYYGSKKALDAFSYEFNPGVYGLIGENGAGKTTLMNIMAGVFVPSEGRIYADKTLVSESSKEYFGAIGYLPQENPMYPEFTVNDYMMYISYLKRCKSNKEEIDRLLELVNLSDKKNDACKRLSGGMKRRLGIAQALIGNPKLLIMDEPTAGVDVMERMKFRNIISGLGKDRIIIFSTHTISDVERIANEMIFLKNGTIICSGEIAGMLSALEGRVWEAEVKQLDYEKIAATCGEKRVTNVNVQGYIFKVRYVYDEPIVEGARNADPSVEDVYADIIG